jgi:hypothetical protein
LALDALALHHAPVGFGFAFGGSQMAVTGCSSMSFGAAPVTPCSSSKKPSPRMLIVWLT